MGLISTSDITQHKITFAWPGAMELWDVAGRSDVLQCHSSSGDHGHI